MTHPLLLISKLKRVENIYAREAAEKLTEQAKRITNLENDAYRYRWLRERATFIEPSTMKLPIFTSAVHDFDNDCQTELWDASVDSTIDAAMAEGLSEVESIIKDTP